MKIFSLQEKQETIEGSALFARFLKESSKDTRCYKRAIHMPSLYHIGMLIKAKHRSAALHSLDGIYFCTCFFACKALYVRQKEVSLHSQWDLYDLEKPFGFFSCRKFLSKQLQEAPHTSLFSMDGVLSLSVMVLRGTGKTVLVKENTGVDDYWPRGLIGLWYSMGDQLCTHRICTLYPIVLTHMRQISAWHTLKIHSIYIKRIGHVLLIPHHAAWEWDGKFTWQLTVLGFTD